MKPFKFLLCFLLFFAVVFGKTLSEIDREIKGAQNRIDKNEHQEGALLSKIEKLSIEIESGNKGLSTIDAMLKDGEKNIMVLLSKVSSEKEEFSTLKKDLDSLIVERNTIEKRLIRVVAKQTAQSIVLSKSGSDNESDIIRHEIFYTMRDRAQKDSLKLKLAYSDKTAQIKKAEKRIDELQTTLSRLKDAENRQKSMRSDQKTLVDRLEKQKTGYLAELNKLIDQKNHERQLLADLKIVKQKTADDMRQPQLSAREAQSREATGAQALNVKHFGTSYQESVGSNYKGKKVKAPLDGKPIVVTKEFGPYTDPIYHIKIHNDSVTLKANENDALVRSVLPGKVVFADNLRLLGKVVIVEHKDNIHTIYRNLEDISPNIKVAGTLKERESIGRIVKELVFEVTKDGLPINPLQLISI
ncbi:peptidase M23 [Campylobacterota bacterium]|nr:peptidase M23 [Campylobacterota bacterium]